MTQPETIAERMALAAREMQDQYDPNSTVKSAVEILVRTVPGCDGASVTLVYGPRKKRQVETTAASHELAAANDHLQQELGEGPDVLLALSIYSNDVDTRSMPRPRRKGWRLPRTSPSP